jgi:hypothetical protein
MDMDGHGSGAGRREVRIGWRMLLFFGILALGMLACVQGAMFLRFYPVGLMYFVATVIRIDPGESPFLWLGYLLYGALLAGFLVCRRRTWVTVLTVAMAVATMFNVVGCHAIWHEASKIGQ